MGSTIVSLLNTTPVFKSGFQLKTESPVTVPLRADLKPQEYNEHEERVNKAHEEYQKMLETAKKNGVPEKETARLYSEKGISPSQMKIEPQKLTITRSEAERTIYYDKKGRETKVTTTGELKTTNFYGKPVTVVKMEQVTDYNDNGNEVTLKNGSSLYSGKLTATSTSAIYAKDKSGKIYKCEVIKYIHINGEPNISEINFYNPDGSKSPESEKGWQIK